jgi:hypothetical protein
METKVSWLIKTYAIHNEKDVIRELLRLCITAGACLLQKDKDIGQLFIEESQNMAELYLNDQEIGDVIQEIKDRFFKTAKFSIF